MRECMTPKRKTIECDHSLVFSKEIRPQAEKFSRKGRYDFCYDSKGQDKLPHVVKFSGGRSSGMLLFTMLEAGLLKADRGDVVIFNNTASEHPATYKFSAECKKVVEEEYGIPFFWIEAQTYEDVRHGEWSRIPTYRLVNQDRKSIDNPDGYSWKGEVFEELISLQGFVPNQFKRICTASLKLETTRAFLKDWFACKESIQHLGHYGDFPRMSLNRMYMKHKKNRGSVPFDIYKDKKEFIMTRPFYRPEQCYKDFTAAFKLFDNDLLNKYRYGDTVVFGGEGSGVEYISFIGLRYDEMRRIIKVRNRNNSQTPEVGYEGEHVYMPLANMYVTKEDVETFWKSQEWDLKLKDGNMSNCTYCFLKGAKVLRSVHSKLSEDMKTNKEYTNTPVDINWWVRLENKYGRDLVAEKRKISTKHKNKVIGFFGIGSEFSYKLLDEAKQSGDDLSEFSNSVLPCDCTD